MNRFAHLMLLGSLSLGLPSWAQAQDSDADGAADAADAFPCDPARAAVSYFPAADSSALFAFEDQWPDATDLDFNDVVVRAHYRLELDASGQATSLFAVFDPVALGGILSNGLGWHLPVSAGSVAVRRRIGGGAWQTVALQTDAQATFVVSNDLRELFAGAADQVNSFPGQPRLVGQRLEVEVTFTQPDLLPWGSVPFDLFIFRAGDLSHQIHLPSYRGTAAMNSALFGTGEDGSTASRAFVHSTGIPAALNLMTSTRYPHEGVRISALFPDILSFASSGGAQNKDFYTSTIVDAQGFDVGAPALPAEPAADRSCVPLGQSVSQAASSCRVLLANGVTTDGVYWIDPDGAGGVSAFEAYCDMTTDGGGWMVVWKNQGGAVGSQASNASLLARTPSGSNPMPPHFVQRGSDINEWAWAWARGQGGLEWVKASTLYAPGGTPAHEQTFRVDFGAVTWDWILSRGSNEACHVAPNPISVVANGVPLGSTDRVNSYQSNRNTFGLANHGNSGQDTCGQSTSNLITDPGNVIYRLDGNNGLNAIRHLFSYVHNSAGRDSSRCNYACWTSNNNGGYSDAFTWMVR